MCDIPELLISLLTKVRSSEILEFVVQVLQVFCRCLVDIGDEFDVWKSLIPRYTDWAIRRTMIKRLWHGLKVEVYVGRLGRAVFVVARF